MKKFYIFILALAFFLAPSGGLLGHDEASAKARGGGFNTGIKPSAPVKSSPSNTVKKPDSSTTNPIKNSSATTKKGGFVKGLLFGGLAGLLLGGLLGNLGSLGAILGILINGLAIAAVIVLAIKLYRYIKNRRLKQSW